MHKYHAKNKAGNSLCGHVAKKWAAVVSVGPAEWNELHESSRCARCVAKIKAMKVAKTN